MTINPIAARSVILSFNSLFTSILMPSATAIVRDKSSDARIECSREIIAHSQAHGPSPDSTEAWQNSLSCIGGVVINRNPFHSYPLSARASAHSNVHPASSAAPRSNCMSNQVELADQRPFSHDALFQIPLPANVPPTGPKVPSSVA